MYLFDGLRLEKMLQLDLALCSKFTWVPDNDMAKNVTQHGFNKSHKLENQVYAELMKCQILISAKQLVFFICPRKRYCCMVSEIASWKCHGKFFIAALIHSLRGLIKRAIGELCELRLIEHRCATCPDDLI